MIRPPIRSDQSYIASTWARSMLSTHAHQRHMSSRTGTQIGKQIDAVMDREDTRALVCVRAATTAHPLGDFILGWVLYCAGPATPTVHYLYTRRDERGIGVAAALLAQIGVARDRGVICTSHGPSSESMRGRWRASVHVPLDEFLKPG